MKVKSETIGNICVARLYALVDGQMGRSGCLGSINTEMWAIHEAQFCLDLERAMAQGKKRVVIDIEYPKP